jgi:hypothetical protein
MKKEGERLKARRGGKGAVWRNTRTLYDAIVRVLGAQKGHRDDLATHFHTSYHRDDLKHNSHTLLISVIGEKCTLNKYHIQRLIDAGVGTIQGPIIYDNQVGKETWDARFEQLVQFKSDHG